MSDHSREHMMPFHGTVLKIVESVLVVRHFECTPTWLLAQTIQNKGRLKPANGDGNGNEFRSLFPLALSIVAGLVCRWSCGSICDNWSLPKSIGMVSAFTECGRSLPWVDCSQSTRANLGSRALRGSIKEFV